MTDPFKVMLEPDPSYEAPKMIITHHASNRLQKRAILRELDKVMPKLVKIESDFVQAIFGKNPHEYAVLFEAADDYYRAMVDHFVRMKTLKLVGLNEDYFTLTYKPLENG